MKRKEICLVVDVETCGGFGRPLVYDMGVAAVVRSTGDIVESHSLILDEIFYGEAELMSSAYYAEKIPFYHEGIANGAFRVVSVWQAWRIVRKMMEKYSISRVYAYNCSFDRGALNSTMKYHTDNKCRNFFPYGTQYCDIWHMACQTVLSQKRYRKFAMANGFVSEAGNLRTSAECAYAYLTKTPDYIEPHTGLEDVKIEIRILHWVLRQKKRISEEIVQNPWMIPQRVPSQAALFR